MANRRFESGAATAALAIVLVVTGCAAHQRDVRTEEGLKAAEDAAQAQARAQAASGEPGAAPAGIPSLDRGEAGSLQLPMNAPPATAPPPDKFDNKNPQHLLARCRDRGARHEWFDAVGDCRKAYELDPSSIEPQVELMHLLIDLQSYGDAEESAKRVLAARPNDAIALYYLAWSYRGRDKFPEAIAALQKAIALQPQRIEFMQALAVSYKLSGNYGKSLETLDKTAKMQPANTKTQAMITQTKTELSEKLGPYLKLVKDKPESFDNQAALAFMYQKYGLSQAALTAYDKALSMMPAPIDKQSNETKKLAAQIHYNRGVVYRELGHPDLGEPALTQSMQLDPSLASFAWYYIGLCRYDQGKMDASIEALRKSVELAPDVADNRQALADAYDKAGKADAASEQRNAVAAIKARDDAERAQVKKEEAAAAAEAAKKEPSAPVPAPPPPSASAPASSGATTGGPSGPEPALDPGKNDESH